MSLNNVASGAVQEQVPANPAANTLAPSTLFLTPSGPPFVTCAVFSFALTPAANSLSLDFLTHTGFISRFSVFESVRLEHISLSVLLRPSSARSFVFAFTNNQAAAPTTVEEFLSWTHSDLVCGASNGSIKNTYDYPSLAPFGLEVKARHVGNSPPFLHGIYSGGTTGGTNVECYVKITVRVSCSGHGIVTPF